MRKYISSITIFFVAYFILAVIIEFGEMTSIIFSLIASVLYYNFFKKGVVSTQIASIDGKNKYENDKEKESDKSEEELENDYDFGEIWNAKPRKGTEAHRVQGEVKKIKKIAEDKQVKELVSDLYFNSIKYYPHWLKNNQIGDHVSSIVSNAIERKENGTKKDHDNEIIGITLNGNDYKFIFRESSFSTPDGEWNTHGLLELFSGNKKILAINASLEHSDYDSNWRPFGIEAFIDGDWMDDFHALKNAKEKDYKEWLLKEAEDPNKTNKLKQNFGIE